MQRLKTRTQFQAVLAGGIIARTPHFALHRAMLDTPVPVAMAPVPVPDLASVATHTPTLPQPKPQTMPTKLLFQVCDVWMGAMVPKRWAKRAVTRNAIKRQIYNVSAVAGKTLPTAAHVVRLRAGFDKAACPSATSDALKAMVRVELNQLFAKAAQQASRAESSSKP